MKTNKCMTTMLAALLLAACGADDTAYDASGVFETTDVIISAKTSGEIVSLSFEEGQDVTAGQELGLIDTTQLQLQKEQLLATQAATTHRKLNPQQQMASLRQQLSNLQREKARFEALLKEGAATQKQVDELDYQITVLQKQLAATSEQLTTTNSSLDGQAGSIAAQVALIDDQIKNAHITSPIAGVILSKYAQQGEYAVPGRILLKVGNVHDMKLRAYITADQLTTLQIGQKVTVFADQGTKGRKAYEGTVTWIADKAEFTPKTIQTRDERANLVYAIKVSVSNDGLIKRGMYGDVKF